LKGKIAMTQMAEAAARLDEYYTTATQNFDSGKPGVFARQKDMAVFLDEFTYKYLAAKTIATKRSPSELISDMVRRELASMP
jgi:hypothetical protein